MATRKKSSKSLDWLVDLFGDVIGKILRRQQDQTNKRFEGVEGRLEELERPPELGPLKTQLTERIESQLNGGSQTKH